MGSQIVYEHLEEAQVKYPKLVELTNKNGLTQINGSIDVIDDEGGYWDTYEVSLIIPSDYPDDLPILMETSHKINRDINWHIGSNGQCCVATRSKMFFDLAGKITLLNWLDKFAHPYLANHVYKIKTGKYAGEEFSHGDQGVLESWKRILQIDNQNKILLYLKQMIGVKGQALNKPCFCGSGKKYKRCYIKNYKEHLRNIPVNQIMDDIEAIANIIGQHCNKYHNY